MKAELIANAYGDPKVIITSPTLFDEIVDELDLTRNHKAYILVPDEDRQAIYTSMGMKGVQHTPASNLIVAPITAKTSSSWKKDGSYGLVHKCLATVTKKGRKIPVKDNSEANDAYESGSAYESGESEYYSDETAYSGMIQHFTNKFIGIIDLHYLKASDAAKLMVTDSQFANKLPRPFMYRASAVFLKDTQQYILVLDSILDRYIDPTAGRSPFREVPNLSPVIQDTLNKDYASVYEMIHGVGSFRVFKDELKTHFNYISSNIQSVIQPAPVSIEPLESAEGLANLEPIYSANPNPKAEELTFVEKEFKFLIGYYNKVPLLVKYQEIVDTLALLDKVTKDPEIYRMFSHNIFDAPAFSRHAYANPKDAPGQVKLYVKNFYEHLGHKKLPFKSFQRVKEWESEPTPEEIAKLKELYQGDPIQAVIDYYNLTGKGISYWYVR